jgi:N-methylhydantoinase A
MTPETADRWAVRLAGSGIAAGAIASRHIASLCGFDNAIGLDMGGTSTDISLVFEGEARVTTEWSVQYGYPIRFPSIEVLTIGAGGGSLAWIDDAGSLRNGPQSAGAEPGPACYGLGGSEPTNTDANLVLGRLGTSLIDGAMTLDVARAEESLRRSVAEPLGLDVADAAEAVVAVANANMADAIRLISVRRGYDPRDFVLVCFGGAGPLHGAELARELSIPAVLVPPNPGTTSALGCLLVDVRHDFFTMLLGTIDSVDPADVEREFALLEDQARERMRVEGVPEDRVELRRTVDMRYAGQNYEREVAMPDGQFSAVTAEEMVRRFARAHDEFYGFSLEGEPVEFVNLRVAAMGRIASDALPFHPPVAEEEPPLGTREVVFDGRPHETAILLRDRLRPGYEAEGPLVVEEAGATTVVPPGRSLRVDELGNLLITREDT